MRRTGSSSTFHDETCSSPWSSTWTVPGRLDLMRQSKPVGWTSASEWTTSTFSTAGGGAGDVDEEEEGEGEGGGRRRKTPSWSIRAEASARTARMTEGSVNVKSGWRRGEGEGIASAHCVLSFEKGGGRERTLAQHVAIGL